MNYFHFHPVTLKRSYAKETGSHSEANKICQSTNSYFCAYNSNNNVFTIMKPLDEIPRNSLLSLATKTPPTETTVSFKELLNCFKNTYLITILGDIDVQLLECRYCIKLPNL
jgi:hypothetical protein